MIVHVFDFSKDRVIECFLNPLIFEPFFYYRHMYIFPHLRNISLIIFNRIS